MYVHLGGNTVIRKSEIIAILDLDNTTTSKITRNFLKEAENRKEVINISQDIPKSYILSEKKLYISQISPNTLAKRCENG